MAVYYMSLPTDDMDASFVMLTSDANFNTKFHRCKCKISMPVPVQDSNANANGKLQNKPEQASKKSNFRNITRVVTSPNTRAIVTEGNTKPPNTSGLKNNQTTQKQTTTIFPIQPQTSQPEKDTLKPTKNSRSREQPRERRNKTTLIFLSSPCGPPKKQSSLFFFFRLLRLSILNFQRQKKEHKQSDQEEQRTQTEAEAKA